MTKTTEIVLILGSGPNAVQAAEWPRQWFDRIVAINNAWRVRPDWDDLIYPEDFPDARKPPVGPPAKRVIEAERFVPAQNAYGGFVYGGGTMAYTAGYWALHALRPRVLAFMGCDMVYPASGPTHFYGTGSADPLRRDPTLQDLGAKSARLGLLAARDGCHCVNLSAERSELLYTRVMPETLRDLAMPHQDWDVVSGILRREEQQGYYVPSGRYWEMQEQLDRAVLAGFDAAWRRAWDRYGTNVSAA